MSRRRPAVVAFRVSVAGRPAAAQALPGLAPMMLCRLSSLRTKGGCGRTRWRSLGCGPRVRHGSSRPDAPVGRRGLRFEGPCNLACTPPRPVPRGANAVPRRAVTSGRWPIRPTPPVRPPCPRWRHCRAENGAASLRRFPVPEWRNWQTRGTQNPVRATECGFEPHLRHQLAWHIGKVPCSSAAERYGRPCGFPAWPQRSPLHRMSAMRLVAMRVPSASRTR